MNDDCYFRFEYLRSKSDDVLDFFIKYFSGENEITIKTDIGQELGICGADADELLFALKERFDIDFSGFEFDKYFYDEGLEFIYVPLLPLLFFNFWIKVLTYIINLFLKSKTLDQVVDFNLIEKIDKLRGLEKSKFTVGDVVVSALFKEFKLRSEVQIQLTN